MAMLDSEFQRKQNEVDIRSAQGGKHGWPYYMKVERQEGP